MSTVTAVHVSFKLLGRNGFIEFSVDNNILVVI